MKKPIARKNDIVVQEVDGETLIYDLKTNKAYCLNETSALVWHLCDGTRTTSEISDALSVRLKTLISEEFVWLALDQLGKDGLLEGESENRFAGLSRRDVIRKVGFASVVGLPMVSSIVAPQASMAQSMAGLPNFSSCLDASQCASGNCANGTTCCVAGAISNQAPGITFAANISADPCAARENICCSNSATEVGPQVGGNTRCQCD